MRLFPYLLFVAFGLGLIGAYGTTLDTNGDQTRSKDRFAYRCELKGGVALYEHKVGRPANTKWLGCYKGVTEIYNEG